MKNSTFDSIQQLALSCTSKPDAEFLRVHFADISIFTDA
ncbi:hypothetical protein SynWH8101_0797 [Synechococcus sp. WH 8101]|nr:hypothetical protein SynWH8101_0797 [Synechococcus sp. WH 8101]QNI44599.1 hypothetical protein SynRCC2555_00811 [Synechococcus sp. WH 8101]